MSDSILLNWAMMSVSFFNTILLLWLGATVLLNAERWDWGMGLAAGGLLLGGAFFVSHTAILGLFIGGHLVSGYTAILSDGLLVIGGNMIFWWTAGLIPALVLPFAWYLVILWYGGFWNDREKQSDSPRRLRFNSPSLYERHRYLFWLVVALLVSGLAGLAAGILLLAIPSPGLLNLRILVRWSIAGIPFMALAYSGYVVLCIALSLDALRRPGPTPRLMGNEARQRARPYLVGASLALLLVSLLVAGALLWAVQSSRSMFLYEFYNQAIEILAWVDLIIAAIIGLVILLLGQAIVSYEVFTGKPLPRHGLMRHWRRAILLAAGYSIPVGFSVAFALRPLYSLLLTTILMTVFFALWSWQSYAERERYIDSLRPFLSSQRLTEQLLTSTPSAPAEVDIMLPFRALCADVLDARLAYLTAVGPLAPLVGPPLAYPEDQERVLSPLTDLITQFRASQTPLTVDPATYGGAIWAIPLWSERGLIGIFLLGPKWGNGLYTQEEIDVARVSGERLIDTKASAEMARRLMALQRERLAQTQIVDQQTRRTLHDDILPETQMAIIALSGETGRSAAAAQAVDTLSGIHRQISNLLREMPVTKVPEVARFGLIRALQQTVEREFAAAFNTVVWQVSPEAAEKEVAIPTLTAEVIFYAAREAVRNAAKYGRGERERPFALTIAIQWQNGLRLQIEDNGVGILADAYPQGGGQGLALHTTMMAVIGGELATESVPGKFTRVTLSLPERH